MTERGGRPRIVPDSCQTQQVGTPIRETARGLKSAAEKDTRTQTDTTMENSITAPKSFNWLKLLGILAIVGVIIAVGRIVLRVFRETPDTDFDNDTEHHEAA